MDDPIPLPARADVASMSLSGDIHPSLAGVRQADPEVCCGCVCCCEAGRRGAARGSGCYLRAHPEPHDLPQVPVRAEEALNGDRVADDDRMQGLYGNR